MSAFGPLSAAWTAVYAYLCAYYCVLYARRRAEREYLAFGLLSGALAIYALGSHLWHQADSLAQAAHAEEVLLFGLLSGAVFAVEFAHHMTGRQSTGVTRAMYALALIGVFANIAHLLVDAGAPPEPDTYVLIAGGPRFTARLTWFGAGALVFGLCAVVYSSTLAALRATTDRDLRIMLAGAVVAMLAGLHDFVARVTQLKSAPLLVHCYLLFALTVSYVLLERFVRTANALNSRTLELRRSYNELRDAQEQLLRREQLATMGELSAVIAHEVRNPLAIIKNAVSSLHRPALRDADRQVLLKILDEEADRLNRLVGDLLAYARPVTPQRQTVHVEDLVRGAVELARAAQQREGSVTFDLQLGEAHTIEGDPDLLRQALVNVAENALQAMPDGGTLTVRTHDAALDTAAAVAISIRDTGEGMDTLVRSKATVPFFTTRPTGTGLGLAIVHRLVLSHGGKVQIESSYGSGTTVSILLPVRGGSRAAQPADLQKPSKGATS
ncbi:MAG: ATP-binding protein [Polyangiales bacterium]